MNTNAAYRWLRDNRHLSPGAGVEVMTIGCSHCHVIWERERGGTRAETAAETRRDREDAIRHLREVHGIAAPSVIGEPT